MDRGGGQSGASQGLVVHRPTQQIVHPEISSLGGRPVGVDDERRADHER